LPSNKPKNLPFREALQDPDTRAEYIRREYKGLVLDRRLSTIADLQLLQWWTDHFVTALTQSTAKMPYGMRYIARETLIAMRVSLRLNNLGKILIVLIVQERFPDSPDEVYAACIARLVYYRYINPAIM
jgi:Ras GTPase-activating-like protein IQGAP2/3